MAERLPADYELGLVGLEFGEKLARVGYGLEDLARAIRVELEPGVYDGKHEGWFPDPQAPEGQGAPGSLGE